MPRRARSHRDRREPALQPQLRLRRRRSSRSGARLERAQAASVPICREAPPTRLALPLGAGARRWRRCSRRWRRWRARWRRLRGVSRRDQGRAPRLAEGIGARAVARGAGARASVHAGQRCARARGGARGAADRSAAAIAPSNSPHGGGGGEFGGVALNAHRLERRVLLEHRATALERRLPLVRQATQRRAVRALLVGAAPAQRLERVEVVGAAWRAAAAPRPCGARRCAPPGGAPAPRAPRARAAQRLVVGVHRRQRARHLARASTRCPRRAARASDLGAKLLAAPPPCAPASPSRRSAATAFSSAAAACATTPRAAD